MRVWGKTRVPATTVASVARKALEAVSRSGLVREALKTLLESGPDRAGVWIEGEAGGQDNGDFHGLVADPQRGEIPGEWTRLSPQSSLPQEVLSGVRGVLQDVDPRSLRGVMTGMSKALWLPVESRGDLRGVVFVGLRDKSSVTPWSIARSVAAELGLALELYDERLRNLAQRANTRAARSVVDLLNSKASASQALSEIAKQCTRDGGAATGRLALFAAIAGPMHEPRIGRYELNESEGHAPQLQIQFEWRSGDSRWTQRLGEERFQSVWRQALAQRRVIGTEVRDPQSPGELIRMIAIPLQADSVTLGMLVAGLGETTSSLAVLEALELQGALASAVLRRQRFEEELQSHRLREAVLVAEFQATTVELDFESRVVGTDAPGTGLAGVLPPTKESEPGPFFTALFSADSVERVGRWFEESKAHRASDVLDQAKLRDGHGVRLQLLPHSRFENKTILLQPVAGTEPPAKADPLAELRNVIEWLEEGVVLFGANHEIRAMNSRMIQLLDLAPEEANQLRGAADLVTALLARIGTGGSHSQLWLRSAGSSQAAIRDEIQIDRPAQRLLERVGHPLTDENGAMLGRVEIYRDLTVQRLFQSKLLQTGRLAELGQMLTAVAHELSNPLTSILGYAQRLAQRGSASNASREAKQIFEEAERASEILGQLLRSARESRRERRRISLNRLVSRTIELHDADLTQKTAKLEVDLDPALPFVQGDPGQLQQVLQNLIGNARQALAGNDKNPTIRVATRRASLHRVLLEVSDNGSGIPPSIQNRIFDPFFTTKPAGVGTGLGLSIVSGIVREHGGDIRVSSVLGKGSVFSVELPAATALEIETTKPHKQDGLEDPGQLFKHPEGPPSVPGLGQWAGARVLVLEDEPTVARLIADVLEDEGLTVDTVVDGREALSRVNQDYALVICDMKMPRLDGEEFYRTLLRERHPLRQRFLFVTGDVLSAHTRNFLGGHRLPYVAKPFRVEELTAKVRGVLERADVDVPGPTKKSAATNNRG